MRWTPFCDECVEFLEMSPSAGPSDKYFCQWLRIQHIAEDVGVHFSIEDPSRFLKTDELRIRYMVKGFEAQLQLCATKSLAGDSRKTIDHQQLSHFGLITSSIPPPHTRNDVSLPKRSSNARRPTRRGSPTAFYRRHPQQPPAQSESRPQIVRH